uniref:Uncharacterized protein n=2 Tax=Caenorhabditis japonica TaxID=281687 RepID=A0A8R1HVL9_CAEJA
MHQGIYQTNYQRYPYFQPQSHFQPSVPVFQQFPPTYPRQSYPTFIPQSTQFQHPCEGYPVQRIVEPYQPDLMPLKYDIPIPLGQSCEKVVRFQIAEPMPATPTPEPVHATPPPAPAAPENQDPNQHLHDDPRLQGLFRKTTATAIKWRIKEEFISDDGFEKALGLKTSSQESRNSTIEAPLLRASLLATKETTPAAEKTQRTQDSEILNHTLLAPRNPSPERTEIQSNSQFDSQEEAPITDKPEASIEVLPADREIVLPNTSTSTNCTDCTDSLPERAETELADLSFLSLPTFLVNWKMWNEAVESTSNRRFYRKFGPKNCSNSFFNADPSGPQYLVLPQQASAPPRPHVMYARYMAYRKERQAKMEPGKNWKQQFKKWSNLSDGAKNSWRDAFQKFKIEQKAQLDKGWIKMKPRTRVVR